MNAFDVGNGDTGELPASSYFASVDLELVKDELYSIEITYAERIGQTKLVLYWESDSQVFANEGEHSNLWLVIYLCLCNRLYSYIRGVG